MPKIIVISGNIYMVDFCIEACISSSLPAVFLASFCSAEIAGNIIIEEANCNKAAKIKIGPGRGKGKPEMTNLSDLVISRYKNRVFNCTVSSNLKGGYK